MLAICWEIRAEQTQSCSTFQLNNRDWGRVGKSERDRESGQSAGVSSVLFYVFLNSFHFPFCCCCLLKNIFLGNYASTRWSSVACNMCPSHAHSLELPASLLPACLPKVILHVVHCFICLIIVHSLLSSPRRRLQSAVATFYWNEIPVFFSFSQFQFYFSFFHIFCNNLYSWCVPASRWALSLSHGWCSTTVYWLGIPSPPRRTPLCGATLILNSFRCGLQHWNWGQCLSYWVRWIQMI